MTAVETVHVGVRVPADLADAIKKIADRNDRSPSAEIRRALKAHVEAEQKAAA